MTAPVPVPDSLGRLFPEWCGEPPAVSDPMVLGRILEDGEDADLRWLCRAAGEEELRRWLHERGGRQLSTRSRAFWQLVLEVEARAPAPLVEELWSL